MPWAAEALLSRLRWRIQAMTTMPYCIPSTNRPCPLRRRRVPWNFSGTRLDSWWAVLASSSRVGTYRGQGSGHLTDCLCLALPEARGRGQWSSRALSLRCLHVFAHSRPSSTKTCPIPQQPPKPDLDLDPLPNLPTYLPSAVPQNHFFFSPSPPVQSPST